MEGKWKWDKVEEVKKAVLKIPPHNLAGMAKWLSINL